MSSFDVTQINPNERNYDDTWSTVPQLSGSLKINNLPSVSITIDDVLFIFNQLGLVQSNKFIIDKHVFDLSATYDIWKYHKYNHDSERVYNYWVFEIENCKYNISNLIDKKIQQNRNSVTSEDAVVYNLLLSYCNGRSRGLDFDYYPTGNNAHFDLYDGYSGDLTFKVEVHPDLKPTTVDAQHFLELIGFDLADSNVVMMSTKSKIYRSPVHEEEFPGKV